MHPRRHSPLRRVNGPNLGRVLLQRHQPLPLNCKPSGHLLFLEFLDHDLLRLPPRLLFSPSHQTLLLPLGLEVRRSVHRLRFVNDPLYAPLPKTENSFRPNHPTPLRIMMLEGPQRLVKLILGLLRPESGLVLQRQHRQQHQVHLQPLPESFRPLLRLHQRILPHRMSP